MMRHTSSVLSKSLLAGAALGVLALGRAVDAAAQTGSIRGQVTNAETRERVRGVRVMVVGTNVQAATNDEGTYVITRAPVGEHVLRAMIIGFAPQTQAATVQAGGTAVVDFALSASAIRLEEVVVNAVTGREQRERELGTNVSSIDVQALNPAQVTSVSDVLSGRTEGVFLQDINGTSGTSQRIRIRGANSLSLSNEPLVYIDGVRMQSVNAISIGVGGQDASRLNDLNPNDIESIEVVKGPAAAATYGTAAANGVLLIATKRGRPGAAEWNFYTETGSIKDITDYPPNYMAYQVNGDPTASFYYPSTRDWNGDRIISDGSVLPSELIGAFNTVDYAYCPNRSAAAGSCRQDRVAIFNTLRDARTTPFSTGERQRYGVNVRGGTERVTYYVSGELEDETGVIAYNQRDKVTVRANLNAALNDRFDLDVSTAFNTLRNSFPNNDNSIFSPILNGLLGEGYFLPDSVKRADELAGVNRRNYGFAFNQFDNGNFVTNDDAERVILSANARYRPLSWLALNATGGVDLADGHTFVTLQPGLLPISESFEGGFRESDRANRFSYTFNSGATASFRPFQDIVSTTTIGWSFNEERLERSECFGAFLVQGTSSCGTTSSLFEVDEDFESVKTVGGSISTEVGWRERVFFSAALRGDDNSAFGADFGFVTYPSVMASWVIGEEDWFPRGRVLSALRLRAAYGESGLRPNFRDAETLYDAVTVARGGGDVSGITVSTTGNVDLKPEKSREIEMGFDAALFNNRVGIDFTYFDKRSRNALVSRRLPGSFGVDDERFENLGEIKNAGTELAVRVNAIDRGKIGLNLSLTLTTLDNEVIEIGENVEDIIFNRGLQRHKKGFPAGAFFQRPVTWNDANRNGKLTNAEVRLGTEDVFIGPPLPTWQTSLGANLRLFDWLTVSTLFEFRGGNYQGNDSEAFRCGFRSTRGCLAVGNPNASLEEQATYIADRFLGSSFGYVEKADFGKWREASVTFQAPRSLIARVPRLEGLSLTLAGRNLATWTQYSGLDPETVEAGGDANFSQSEFNTQPPVRMLLVRLNYTLR
jgi:TonB-dependent starch-binding outer membrane protein SusC